MTSRLPWRRSAVPSDLRARVPLASGEKILGWSWLPGGGWSVATTDELLVSAAGAGTDDEPLRLPWYLVTSATWEQGVLDVVAATSPTSRPEAFHLDITEEGLLAEAVNTLVTGSIVWSRRIEERPLASALFTVRRAPEDSYRWSVVFDRGFDAADPALRAWADERISELKEQTGLEG